MDIDQLLFYKIEDKAKEGDIWKFRRWEKALLYWLNRYMNNNKCIWGKYNMIG